MSPILEVVQRVTGAGVAAALKRDEGLNVHQSTSMGHARAMIKAWRIDYNQERPHGSLGDLTPAEYAATDQEPSTSAAA